jgi:membrane-associated phospholipid phosphatase
VLLLFALGLLGAVVLTVRLSASHARGAWDRARSAFSALARRPAMLALERRFPLVWRLMRTLTATEYLVVHLALGFAAAAGAVMFMLLASEVTTGRTLVGLDVALAQSLHASASDLTISFFRRFTYLGSEGVVVMGFAVAGLLAWTRRRLLAIGWAVALIGAAILNSALKGLYSRPRTSFENPIVTPRGWSFPSGHAMTTWIAMGMLVYLSLEFVKSPPRRAMIVTAALAFSVSMGFSRMVIGAHYLTDVLAGFAAGTVWLGACVSGLEIARRRPGGAA